MLHTATQIIAKGNRPNVQGLYAQQFAVMATDYKERQKTDFPLTLFKERAFEMRLNDERALNTDGIPATSFNLLAAHHPEKMTPSVWGWVGLGVWGWWLERVGLPPLYVRLWCDFRVMIRTRPGKMTPSGWGWVGAGRDYCAYVV